MAFDVASSSQRTRLRNHILNDVPGIGLSWTKTNGANRRLMESASTESGAVGNVTALEMQSAVDGNELLAITPPKRQAWQALLVAVSSHGVDLAHASIDSQVAAIWDTSTDTLAALGALKTKTDITYSEDLFGVGTILTKRDIASART